MSLEKFKAKFGSISSVKMAMIRNVSPANYDVLVELPRLIRVVEWSMEVDMHPGDVPTLNELRRAIDIMEDS